LTLASCGEAASAPALRRFSLGRAPEYLKFDVSFTTCNVSVEGTLRPDKRNTDRDHLVVGGQVGQVGQGAGGVGLAAVRLGVEIAAEEAAVGAVRVRRRFGVRQRRRRQWRRRRRWQRRRRRRGGQSLQRCDAAQRFVRAALERPLRNVIQNYFFKCIKH